MKSNDPFDEEPDKDSIDYLIGATCLCIIGWLGHCIISRLLL